MGRLETRHWPHPAPQVRVWRLLLFEWEIVSPLGQRPIFWMAHYNWLHAHLATWLGVCTMRLFGNGACTQISKAGSLRTVSKPWLSSSCLSSLCRLPTLTSGLQLVTMRCRKAHSPYIFQAMILSTLLWEEASLTLKGLTSKYTCVGLRVINLIPQHYNLDCNPKHTL